MKNQESTPEKTNGLDKRDCFCIVYSKILDSIKGQKKTNFIDLDLNPLLTLQISESKQRNLR